MLSKHLSFVPLPEKLNTTQLKYDFTIFSRTCRWTEDCKDLEDTRTETIFPQKKHNLPKHAPSPPLAKFLYGVETDLLAGKPGFTQPNLQKDEKIALKELVNLQRDGSLVIQRCDKGGATAIMNREDYIAEVTDQHLKSTVQVESGEKIPVYREVDPLMLTVHQTHIQKIVDEAAQEGFITEQERFALIPAKPSEARAYGLVKAHKAVPEGKNIPPLRLVISGCGSNTENASLFIDHHCKHIPASLPSHVQDTPHLLRILDEENKTHTQTDTSILVTIDVVGLYPNIPQEEGCDAFYEKIRDPGLRDQSIPAYFLMLLLQCVLQFNIFVFNGAYYLQEWGTCIGTRVAPTYANIFMGVLEDKLLKAWKGTVPELWRRYIDDIFTVWKGTEDELIQFLTFMNSFHSTIKFTAEYRTRSHQVQVSWKENSGLVVKRNEIGDLRPRSVDFLDMTIWIDENGKFQTDLYTKETDRITYLLPSSTHPGHITTNMPYSGGLRLLRICSKHEDYLKRREEFSENLKTRGYKDIVIKTAFKRLDSITREQALLKVSRTKVDQQRPVFAITYDPRLPSASGILKKHYNVACENPTFKDTFPLVPLVGYRRSRNLGEYLTKAKLFPVGRSGLRTRSGFQRCNRVAGGLCMMCTFSTNCTSHECAYTKEKFEIQSMIKCTDTYIIYSITCKLCPKVQYIGQTYQTAAKRFSTHHSDIITKKVHKPVAAHFNLPGHGTSAMIFLPFEKLRFPDKTMLDVREDFWIQKKKTFLYGLNKC